MISFDEKSYIGLYLVILYRPILGYESFSISDLLPTSYGQPGDVPCEALDREVHVSHVDKEMAAFLIVVAYFPACHMSDFKMGMSYKKNVSPVTWH